MFNPPDSFHIARQGDKECQLHMTIQGWPGYSTFRTRKPAQNILCFSKRTTPQAY